jgi:site-specific DNA recombinase
MNKRYFAYIRVSTVKQGERGSSLAEQKSAIEAYATRYELPIIRWFEETETAAKQGRRLFSLMLSELHAQKAQGMIVHKIDRSARNLRDWADIADLLDRGIDVRFVSDNFDLLSTGGRLSADIIAAVSANYIRNLRDEVKKGMYGRLKQGFYPWQAPIGYLDQGSAKAKTVDPVKGPLVRNLFEKYGSNTIGFRALRREMHARGLCTKASKPLEMNTLTLILRNPFYMGVIKVRTTGETFLGIHEPLISKALYERVQAIMDGRTVPKARKHRFLFRQLIHCDNCGRRTLTGENHRGLTYYRCHHENCRGLSWSEKKLEVAALSQIGRIRLEAGDVGDFRDLVAVLLRDQGDDTERLRTSLDLRVQNVDARLARLTDLLIDETIDKVTYATRREALVMERRDLLDQLERAKHRSPFEDTCAEFERENRELLRYESLTDDEKRELFDIVCSNFSVGRESSTITLRTPYKEIAELEDSEECPPYRDDVRVRKIVDILKDVTEKA